MEIDKKFKNVSEIAKATGLNPTTIGYYLKDKSLPRSEEMLKLSRALGVSMEYLLTGEGPSVTDASAEEWKTRALAAEAKLAQLSALLGQSITAGTPTLREVTTLKKPKNNFTPSPDIQAGASTHTNKRITPNEDGKSA